MFRSTFASWNYESNITDATQKVSDRATEAASLLTKKLGKEAQKFDIAQIQNLDVKRKLKLMKNIGTAALPKQQLKEFIELTTNMGKAYSTAKGSSTNTGG